MLPLEYINLYSMAGEEAVLYDAEGRKDRVLEFGFVINSDIEEEKLEKLLRFYRLSVFRRRHGIHELGRARTAL